MLASRKTEQRILKAMEHGAQLVFHYSYHIDYGVSVTEITLEHNGSKLSISGARPHYREYFYDQRRDETYLRNPNGRDYSWREVAFRIVESDFVREEYAGYRGNHDTSWRELFVHKSMPVPRWVTEQWGFDEQGVVEVNWP